MIRTTGPFALLALVAALALPVQAQAVKTKDFSGWMEDYESLVYIEDRNAFLFTNEDRRGTYEKVLLQEVSLFGTNVKAGGELATQAADYLREGILAIFEEEGVLATKPGPGVARLSLAITGVEKSLESAKPRDFIPVAAVFRGAKRASGNLGTYIDVMFEGKATDSVSGERIMAIVTRVYGDTDKKSGDELEFEDLLPTLDRWLAQYRVTATEFLANRE